MHGYDPRISDRGHTKILLREANTSTVWEFEGRMVEAPYIIKHEDGSMEEYTHRNGARRSRRTLHEAAQLVHDAQPPLQHPRDGSLVKELGVNQLDFNLVDGSVLILV